MPFVVCTSHACPHAPMRCQGYNPELPDGGLPPPDPERWLPKWQRSEFKKKKLKSAQREKAAVKGSQVGAKFRPTLCGSCMCWLERTSPVECRRVLAKLMMHWTGQKLMQANQLIIRHRAPSSRSSQLVQRRARNRLLLGCMLLLSCKRGQFFVMFVGRFDWLHHVL